MSFYKGFSLLFLCISVSRLISYRFLVDPSLCLVLLSRRRPFYISRASDFYVLRHSALVFLGFVLV